MFDTNGVVAPTALRPPDLDRRLDYACDRFGQFPRGRCRLRVWHDQHVALVTELDDNPGMSVTNAAEYVADAVLSLIGVGYMLVEHYESGVRLPHRFAVVHACPSRVATWSPLPAHLAWLRDAVGEAMTLGGRTSEERER